MISGLLARLTKMTRDEEKLLSPKLTTPMIFGFDINKGPHNRTIPSRTIIIKGPTPRLLMMGTRYSNTLIRVKQIEPDVIAKKGSDPEKYVKVLNRQPNLTRRDVYVQGVSKQRQNLVERGRGTTKTMEIEQRITTRIGQENTTRRNDTNLVSALQEKPRNRQIWRYIEVKRQDWIKALDSHMCRPAREVPNFIMECFEFIEGLRNVRNQDDYCDLIHRAGNEYLLTPQQLRTLDKKHKFENLVILVEVVQDLVTELTKIDT